MFSINSFYLKTLIEQRGMTQSQLAEKIGTNEGSLSNLLNKKQKRLDLELAFKLCKELNITISDMILDTSKQTHEPTEEELLAQMHFTLDKLYKTFTYYKLKKDSGFSRYAKEIIRKIEDYDISRNEKEKMIKKIIDEL